ncbi:endogenous retrovirus group S71 member 1 Env polyprotein-like [Pan troglodytes]|uniref:endogenous retrovirus group S71 member 1 Env polyprotein-like n=1 Tax=Pan troglodytes TaxID=9598 RepID=UPI0030136B7D
MSYMVAGRVFANTTWMAGTSKEVTFAVDLCALFPEPACTHEEQHNLPVIGAESVDLAVGFGHSGSQTGCGSSKGLEVYSGRVRELWSAAFPLLSSPPSSVSAFGLFKAARGKEKRISQAWPTYD